jgi:hypothetical protein
MNAKILVSHKRIVLACNGIIQRHRYSKGFRYIVELIVNHKKEVPFNSFDQPDIAEYEVIADSCITEDSIHFDNSNGHRQAQFYSSLRIPLTDEKTINDCYREIRLLKQRHKEASENNDLGMIESINDEIEKITEYITETVNPQTGKINYFPDDNRRASRSVLVAIYRALDLVRSKDYKLALALRKSLRLGLVSSFHPINGFTVTVVTETGETQE